MDPGFRLENCMVFVSPLADGKTGWQALRPNGLFQHRRISVRNAGKAGMIAARIQHSMQARQIVGRHGCEEMMFQMEVHKVGRDEQALDKIGARGVGVAARLGIIAVHRHAMLADIAQAHEGGKDEEARHPPQADRPEAACEGKGNDQHGLKHQEGGLP